MNCLIGAPIGLVSLIPGTALVHDGQVRRAACPGMQVRRYRPREEPAQRSLQVLLITSAP